MNIRIIIVAVTLLISSCAHGVTENDCRAGISAASMGDSARALMLWGEIPNTTYKQRVNNAAECLKYAKIATTMQEIMQWLRSAESKGAIEAKLHLALWYFDKTKANDAKAYQLASEAVDVENPDAYWILGMFTMSGIGTEKNIEKGNELIHQAASLGSIYAISYLNEINKE